MQKGIIKRLMDKWYGFISLNSGKDIFFHASEMEGWYEHFEDLSEGMEVEFEITDGKNWQKKAVNVRVGMNSEGSENDETNED